MVTASDSDLGPELQYSFASEGNPGEKFSIDSTSGSISVAQALDYETASEYTLIVECTDQAHVVSTHVLVQLLDVNDNAPMFTSKLYEVSMHASLGFQVGSQI